MSSFVNLGSVKMLSFVFICEGEMEKYFLCRLKIIYTIIQTNNAMT